MPATSGAKIAIITDSFYAINGVSRTYQELVKYCRHKNLAVDIFTIGKTTKTKKLGSVRIYQFTAVWPVNYYHDLPPFDAKIISPGFKEKLLSGKYDIFHLATPGSLGIAARILLAKNPTPKIGVFHTLLAEYVSCWTKNGLKKLPDYIRDSMTDLSHAATWRFLKWFYAKTDLVLAPTQTIKDNLKILGRPIEIFPRGVKTEIFSPKYKSPKRKEKLPVALYVGRLSTEKNLDLLVSVFKNRTDVKLWLAGEGPYGQGLKAQLPKATFFGYLSGSKLGWVYANADFFVFPSVTDTFGNVILEAQASGLPAIVTDRGGPKELVSHNIDGLISEPTPKAFGQAVDLLIKNQAKRELMGQKARVKALSQSWDKTFDRLFEIYQKLKLTL